MHHKLKNKTVALVGPASSLKGQQKGQYIDSFDYVVRINYANIQSVLDAGSRTDIVYYDGSYHNYDNCNPSILVFLDEAIVLNLFKLSSVLIPTKQPVFLPSEYHSPNKTINSSNSIPYLKKGK